MVLPVDPVLFSFFIGAVFVLVLTPGPIVSLIIAETLNEGPKHGLAVVMGAEVIGVAMLILYVAGFSAIVANLSGPLMDAIRYAGALYLLWLAYNSFTKQQESIDPSRVPTERTTAQAFRASLMIAATNPKAILFFAAFFPQFISPDLPTLPQLITLAVTFAILAPLLDCCWVLVAAGARRLLMSKGTTQLINRVSGAILGSGAILLAFLNT